MSPVLRRFLQTGTSGKNSLGYQKYSIPPFYKQHRGNIPFGLVCHSSVDAGPKLTHVQNSLNLPGTSIGSVISPRNADY